MQQTLLEIIVMLGLHYFIIEYCTLTHMVPQYKFDIFTHLKFCVDTASHSFKWVKTTRIYLIWDKKMNFLIFKHKIRSQ